MSTPTDNEYRVVCGGGCFNRQDSRLRVFVWKSFPPWHQTNRDQGFRVFRPSRLPSPNQDTP